MSRLLLPLMMALWLTGCSDEREALEVDLTTQRLPAEEIDEWPAPAVESGQPEIIVRQVFTAQGPCRELHAELMPRYPGEFMLRVVAEDRSPCPTDTPHIGYAAVLRGLPAGSHRLRVVHVGADGRTLAEAPQRILVPMAKPATAEALMSLALLIREPDSSEPVYPLTVVPQDASEGSQINVATAEKMLSHAVTHAAGAGVPVVPLTRVDHNFASGIARGIAENRISTVIIGWDGNRSARRGIFGSVLDQLLEQTKQQVMVTKVGHPFNTTERIIVLIPQGADHTPGFLESVHTIKRMANRLGATIHGYTVGAPSRIYQAHLDTVKPEAPTTIERASGWGDAIQLLSEELRQDDLVVVLSARHGAIAWDAALERLPAKLADMGPESFIMMYPSEVVAPVGDGPAAGALPQTLTPDRVLLDLRTRDYREALRQLLNTDFESEPERLEKIEAALMRGVQSFAPELQPGVVVPHARIPGLRRTRVFLGVSEEGIEFPHASEPARLIFIVLTPEDQPLEHLSRLAEIARLVANPNEVERLLRAESLEDLDPRKAQDRLSISSRPDQPQDAVR